MKTAWRMEELVTRHSTIMDKYDPAKKTALVVDEWGGWYNVEPGTNPGFLYQQNTKVCVYISTTFIYIIEREITKMIRWIHQVILGMDGPDK